MVTITRTFGFDAGHRVLGHEGKCASLHGHRYTAEVTCSAAGLDQLGRVIDFSKVKEVVGGWLDSHWDHTMILHHMDPMTQAYRTNSREVREALFGPRTPFIMDCNPTAENMAVLLLSVANDLLKPFGIRVVHIKLYETPNCWACTDALGALAVLPRQVVEDKEVARG